MTTIQQLADFSDGQQIEEIEGVLRKVFDPNDTKFGPRQNGYLVDSSGEHRICFAGGPVLQNPDNQGKKFRLKSKAGQRGSTGVKMKVETGGDGKVYRKIWVTPTAIIEILENNQPVTSPSSNGGTKVHTAVVPIQMAGLTAEQLAQRWAELSVLVHGAFTSEGFSEDVADQAALKAPEWGPLWWFGEKSLRFDQPQSTEAMDTEFVSADGPAVVPTSDPVPESARQVSSWSDYVHPKSGMTLGQIYEQDNDKFLKFVAWAMLFRGEAEEAKALQARLLTGAAEKNITAKNIFEMRVVERLGADNMDVNALNKFSNAEFGVNWAELTEDDHLKLLKGADEALKSIEKVHAEVPEDDIPY